MILCDICEYRYIRPESFDIIQLKTADLSHIPFLRFFGHLPGKRIAYISNHCTIEIALITYMIHQCSGGRFSITSGDTNNFALILKSVSQFDFTDYRYTLFSNFFHDFILLRYSRAFHDFLCIQNLFFCMLSTLKCNSMLLQFLIIILFDKSAVRNKYIVAFPTCEYCCTDSAFSSTEYDKSFAHSIASFNSQVD